MNLDNSHHTFRKTTKRKRPLRTLALVHLAIATEYCASAFVPSDTCVQKFLYQQTKRKDVALCSSRKPSDTYYNDEDDFPGRQTPSPRYPRPPLDYSDPLPPKKSSSNQAPSQERFRRIDEPSKDPIQRYPPQRRPDPSGSRFDDEDEYYDDDQYYDDGDYYDDYDYVEDEEEEVTGGNYWSNPPARYDEVRKPKRRVPRPDDPPRVRSTRPSRTRPGSSGNTRRSTFRSGTPQPPPVFKDLYNQLFWYGFDPDDAASSPADKTMFGGTKGKFNGLAYFGGTQENAPAPHRRALSRDNYYDYYEGENEEEDENFNDTLDRLAVEQDRYDSVSSSHLRRRNYNGYFDNDDVDDGQGPVGHKMNSKLIPHEKHYFVTPPNDQPRPIMNGEFSFDVNPPPPPPARSSGTKPQRRRRPRRSPWEDDEDDIPVNNYYDDEEEQVVDFERPSRRRSPNNKSQREGWVSSRVSNWFTDEEDENDDWRNNDDDDDDDDNFDGRPKRRRPRGRKSSSSLWKSPFEVVGSFFGLDNQELNTQAEMYNRQMGIGSKSNQRKGKRMTGRSRDRSPDLRRKGYAYRLDVDMAKYGSVVDADVISDETTGEEVTDTVAEEAQMEEVKRETTDSSRDDGGPKDRNPKEDSEPKRKVRSWEERSIAMERIPPSDVPAWGPSGDLGMDARMKATIDALQDIQEAKYRLEQKIKREQQALDDITILKVDLGVQKRRLEANKEEARMMRKDIRQIELEIENAARDLRKARDQVKYAKDKLSELDDRHWAILSLYNPARAEEGVAEALRELAENEPAARLQNREKNASEGTSSNNPQNKQT